MHTRNETRVRAPLARCVRAAADVERWPLFLPHYREVRFLRKDGFGRGRVHMAALRRFGRFPYPIWWVSEMETDLEGGMVRYRHVRGITAGMDVEWRLTPLGGRTHITILHEWTGPSWPLVGGVAARRVIGPRFIHVVAERTLTGLRRELECHPPETAPAERHIPEPRDG